MPVMTAPWPSALDELPTDRRWQRFAVRGVLSVLAGAAIGVVLWGLSSGSRFTSQMVYSMSIALCTWVLIDGIRTALRELFERGPLRRSASGWPGSRWVLTVLVPVGALMGYTLGSLLAAAILGHAAITPFDAPRSELLPILVLALVPAFAVTFFFHYREVISTQRAQVERAAQQATEERLKLLESQLEPHMLFNTLANLRALIGQDPRRAQAMLDRLIAFLRASLAASRTTTHPLAREFERLGDYLALMQVRMGERLQTRLVLPPELADDPVPPLLLQPLAENAIRHGLEPKRDGGRLEIEARRDAHDRLVLRVRDTGLGLGASPHAPADARTDHREGHLEEPAGAVTGVGTALVRERLATLYGDAATFTLEPAGDAEGGVVATLVMPRRPRPATP